MQHLHVPSGLIEPLIDDVEPLIDSIETLIDSIELLIDAVEPFVDSIEPVPDRRKLHANLFAKLQNLRLDGGNPGWQFP